MKLAVAGGHSKASAVAFTGSTNSTWRVLASASIDRGLNLHSRDAREVGRRFKHLIEKLAKRLGYSGELFDVFESLSLALPGAATKEDQTLADAALIRAGWRSESVLVIDDTWAGLIAGALSNSGICAVAGTGSSVFVGLGSFPLDRVNKIDGWGPFVGDRGSGFQVAMRMLRGIARLADRGQTSQLTQKFFEAHPGLATASRLQEWFDQCVYENSTDWNVEMAKLAMIAVQAADDLDEKDEEAQALIDHAAAQISASILIAIERFLPATEGMPIVLQGSMFEHSKRYTNKVIESVSRQRSNPITMSRRRPLYGAMLYAMLKNTSGFTAAAIHENEARIEVIPPDYGADLYY